MISAWFGLLPVLWAFVTLISGVQVMIFPFLCCEVRDKSHVFPSMRGETKCSRRRGPWFIYGHSPHRVHYVCDAVDPQSSVWQTIEFCKFAHMYLLSRILLSTRLLMAPFTLTKSCWKHMEVYHIICHACTFVLYEYESPKVKRHTHTYFRDTSVPRADGTIYDTGWIVKVTCARIAYQFG